MISFHHLEAVLDGVTPVLLGVDVNAPAMVLSNKETAQSIDIFSSSSLNHSSERGVSRIPIILEYLFVAKLYV